MKSPRTAYRLASVLGPLAFAAALLAAIGGMWLFAAVMAISGVGMFVNRRAMRRRGIDWNGPTTYSELRRRQKALRSSGRLDA
jgi:hypothetical protein